MNTALFPPLLGLIGMIAAFVVYMLVMKYPDGEDKVKKNWRPNSWRRPSIYENRV